MTPFVRLGDLSTQLGESLVWDDRRNLVFLCDIAACQIHAVDLSQGLRQSWTFGSKVGSLGLCESGRLVVALTHTVILFDPDSNAQNELAAVGPLPDGCRLNDGKVGPDGCFWVGSMDESAEPQPLGALYRVDSNGRFERKVGNFKVSNGLAWSPEGKQLYHSDSRGPWIDRYAFDPATGGLGDRLRFAEPDEATGRPDGGTCDSEGCYWSAGVSAGCLNRFLPSGLLADSYQLPVRSPTMPCFCGTDLRTLLVTSHRLGPRNAHSPQAGGIFTARADVAGVPAFRMKGV